MGHKFLATNFLGTSQPRKFIPLGCIFSNSHKRVTLKVRHTPNMVEEASKAGMATNRDSETEEEPPGLVSESEASDSSDDSDFEDNGEKDSESESEEECDGTHAKAAPARKKGNKRSGSPLVALPKVRVKRKNQRNTSHASKLECIDVQEIKHCLQTKGCSCGKDCLKKLRQHGARAVRALEKLRLQRFQGKYAFDMQNAHHHFSHTPG